MTAPSKGRVGVRHVSYMATSPSGEVGMAIAHLEPDGTAAIDEVKVMLVAGGEAGIDAVYRGLMAQGIDVHDGRKDWPSGLRADGDVKARAIAGALRLARSE